MDRTTGLREEAAVCDFVALLLEDLAQDAVRSLEDYQARFPDYRTRIAREYQEILAEWATPGHSSDEDPQDVGPYRLLRRLGHGGQGVVFLAEHRDLRRPVALKMLHQHRIGLGGGLGGGLGLGSAQVARLRREAMALARLEHPGICAIYEVELDDPDPYLAMRYVDGDSIAARVEAARETGVELPPRGRHELEVWLEFFERSARALHVAHQAGIVHRDIKPQNLMRTTKGEPVLLDFGLAREIGSPSGVVTESQDMFGTLPYLAPELLDGAIEPSPRADIYALGVTIYETLTLERPFAAVTPSALRDQILAGNFRSPRAAVPGLPESVDLILRTAMERDPRRRYATAEALAEDLRFARLREPLLARPVARWVRTGRWVRRHPTISFSFGLSVIALLVVLLLLARVTEGRSELRALRIAYQAQSLSERAPGKALVLAVQAAHIARHPEIDDVLLQVLDACHEERTIPMPTSGRGVLDSPSDRLSLDPRQRFVAVPLRCGEVPMFRLSNGAVERSFGRHGNGRTFAVFVNGGAGLVTAGDDGQVCAWETESGTNRTSWQLADASADRERVSTLDGSNGGHLVLVGGERGSVRILDPADPSKTLVCSGHDGSVIRSGFDHDDRRVFTLSADLATEMTGDRSLRIFETATGALLRTFGPYEAELRAAAWSPDGGSIAIGLSDGIVEVRDATDGSLLHRFTHQDEVNGVSFDPRRPRLCTGSIDGFVVRNLPSGELLAQHNDFGDRSVTEIAFDRAADHVAVTARDGTTRVYSAESLVLEKTLRAGPSRPNDLAWTPDDSRILTLDGSLHVWFADRRPFLPTMRGHTDRVLCARFDPSGTRVISASRDGTARIWNAADGTQLAVLEHGAPLTGARLALDGTRAITIGGGTPARLWSVESGTSRALGPAVAFDAWFREPEHRLVSVSVDGLLTIHDPETGRPGFERTLHDGSITCAAWHPNRPWLAVGGDDRSVVVFDCARREVVFRTEPWPWLHNPASGRRVFGVAFSPDGGTLVASGEDLSLHAWSSPSGRALWTGPEMATPGAIAVSGRGDRIVVGGQWSPAVSLLGLSDGRLIGPAPVVPDNMITSIRMLHRDPEDLALCADKNGRVALFEVRPARLRSVFRASKGPLLDANFSPDGLSIVTADADGIVRVWPVDPLPVADRYRPSERSDLSGR